MNEPNVLYNIPIEQRLLGAMIYDPSIIPQVEARLDIDDFYPEKHRTVFHELVLFSREFPAFTLEQFFDRLNDNGKLEELGGFWEFTKLCEENFITATAGHWQIDCTILKEKSNRRKLYLTGTEIKIESQSGSEVEDIITETESKFRKIRESSDTEKEIFSIGDKAIETLDHMENRPYIANKIPTGFIDLDYFLLGGLCPGNVILVAGRPSMGKTTLAMNIAANVARTKRSCLFVSLEMSQNEIVERFLLSEARVDPSKSINDDNWITLVKKANESSELPYRVWCPAKLTLTKLANEVRTREKCDLLVIDYLGLIHPPKAENTNIAVSILSRGVHELARELSIPIVLLSQLSRENERRTDKRPHLSDLRDSGSLEQDADVVLMLYRPAVYCTPAQLETKHDIKTQAEILIRKNRMGKTGTVDVLFFPDCVRFENKLKEF